MKNFETLICRASWGDDESVHGPGGCTVQHGQPGATRDAALPLQVPDLGSVYLPSVQPRLQRPGEQGEAGQRLPRHPEPVPVRLSAPQTVPLGQLAGGGAGLANPVIRALRHLSSHLLQAEGYHCRQQAPKVDKKGGGQVVHPLSSDLLVNNDASRS